MNDTTPAQTDDTVKPRKSPEERAARRAARQLAAQGAAAPGAGPEGSRKGKGRGKGKALSEGRAGGDGKGGGGDKGAGKGKAGARGAGKAGAAEGRGAGKGARAAGKGGKGNAAARPLPQFSPSLPRKKLDFIVAGTARSGTTAVGNYLSAVRELHCANEVIPWKADHSTMIAPECFTAPLKDMVDRPNKAKKARKLYDSAKEIAAKGDAVRFYGSKVPMYIHRLRGVLSEIGRPCAIVTTRSLRPVATSYFRRASEPDDQFANGRTGIFAAGDYLMLAHLLAHAPAGQVMLLPHEALVKDWEQTMRAAIGFIAPGLNATFDPAAIGKIKKRYEELKARPARAEAALIPYEDSIVSEVEAMGLDTLLSRDVPYLVDDVQDDLRRMLPSLPKVVPWVEARLADHPLPATRTFMDGKWREMAMTGWQQIYGAQG
jgi:hypothetical protein